MKRTLSTLLAAAAFAAAPLAASAHPVLGNDGVLRWPYADREAPALFCRPLYVCDIILEPGETIVNLAIGDSTRWVVSPASSGTGTTTMHILIKPTEANLSTNMIVTTNRRAYYLDLHSANVTPMVRIGFLYPKTPDAQNTDTDPMQMMGMSGSTSQPLDSNYQDNGSRELYPTSIFNDGKHTYLRLNQQLQELPVLFAIGPDGDQLVNYRVKDGTEYIIDGVPDRIALVVGTGKNQLRAEISRKQ